MKDLTDRTSTIRNQIERIEKEKKKVTPRINNLSPNKTSSNAKRFEKWQILKRRNAQLICRPLNRQRSLFSIIPSKSIGKIQNQQKKKKK